MAADHRHCVVDTVERCKLSFQITVEWTLSSHEPACRNRGAKIVDSSFCRCADPDVAVETQIVIGCKVYHPLTVDNRFGSGSHFMGTKIWNIDARLSSARTQPSMPLLAR